MISRVPYIINRPSLHVLVDRSCSFLFGNGCFFTLFMVQITDVVKSIFVNEVYILQKLPIWEKFVIYIIRWFRGKFVPLQPEIVRRDYSAHIRI